MGQWPEPEACEWLLVRLTGWTLEYVRSLSYWEMMQGLTVLDRWDAGLQARDK